MPKYSVCASSEGNLWSGVVVLTGRSSVPGDHAHTLPGLCWGPKVEVTVFVKSIKDSLLSISLFYKLILLNHFSSKGSLTFFNLLKLFCIGNSSVPFGQGTD